MVQQSRAWRRLRHRRGGCLRPADWHGQHPWHRGQQFDEFDERYQTSWILGDGFYFFEDQFDIKSRALMPIIDSARLIALSHNLKGENNTISRFQKIIEVEPQNKDLYLSCIDAFKIVLRFRTEQGIKNNDSGRYIDLNALTKSEKLKLKGCFKPINDIQDMLNIRYNLAQMMWCSFFKMQKRINDPNIYPFFEISFIAIRFQLCSFSLCLTVTKV